MPHAALVAANETFSHFFVSGLQKTPCSVSHSPPVWHATPAGLAGAHAPDAHARSGRQGWVASHDAFWSPNATQTPLTHAIAGWQSPSTPHAVPALAGSVHVPHTAPDATLHRVPWHWESAPHAAPSASMPGSGAHAAGVLRPTRSAHDIWGIACAHDSICAGVSLVPLDPKTGKSPAFRRDAHVGTSPKASVMYAGAQASVRLQ
jgi:hypothetical protein